jgi:hypothetical protein
VVVAFPVLHGDDQLLPELAPRRERCVGPLDPDRHVRTDELERRVCPEHARKKPGLAEDLEAVADPEDESTLRRESAHGLHSGREPGDRAAAQIVAVRKPAGENHRVHLGERLFRVPDEAYVGAERRERPGRIAVVVRAREDENRDPRRHLAHSATSIS